MTKITYNGDFSITIDGHSGYAERGHDIVCAAVSALWFALKAAVMQRGNVFCDEKDGHAALSCIPREECEHDVRVIFDTVTSAMKALAESYSEYVSFTRLQRE